MGLFEWVNLVITGASCWCFSFAATNFGAKIGKLNGFMNTSGFKYISEMDHDISEKLYDEVVKVAKKAGSKAPYWTKEKGKLKDYCKYYQTSLRYWAETSKYCLVQNNTRHKLIEHKVKLKETPTSECTEEILNAFADTKDSLGFLMGKRYCADEAS